MADTIARAYTVMYSTYVLGCMCSDTLMRHTYPYPHLLSATGPRPVARPRRTASSQPVRLEPADQSLFFITITHSLPAQQQHRLGHPSLPPLQSRAPPRRSTGRAQTSIRTIHAQVTTGTPDENTQLAPHAGQVAKAALLPRGPAEMSADCSRSIVTRRLG